MKYSNLITLASYFYKEAKSEIKKIELLRLLSNPKKSFGIISAYRQADDEMHDLLINKLIDLNLLHQEIQGQWFGQQYGEKSILIPNIDFNILIKLGKLLDQDAVIYKSKEGVIAMYYLHNNTAEVAIPTDGNPSCQIISNKDGKRHFPQQKNTSPSIEKGLWSATKDLSFKFNFLQERKIPWKDENPITKNQYLKLLKTSH